ncbi:MULTISPECIES: DMT family transporter [unclassified Beijerinckia]|uniref:DMT family transporter n=1 Tax=unclassified Beijerinckia TaxID=2638183 RepID=UPI00089767AD|nr:MULTISPECIES: DMT family transporter [unclassified Beijerinckia]MDH7797830.1 drug/metabolite transporter (DMT)-like permease [Beijerinckia sp. GAS462]SED00007.1 Permease of the drug/metabolite transporter (DMT) superfamily [Beijerinckia sp. 28-YEA-48]
MNDAASQNPSLPRLAEPAAAAARPPAQAEGNIPLGIMCMIAATVAFAATHAVSKWLIANYPIGQVMFSRSLVGLVIASAILLPIHGFSVYGTKQPQNHLMRGLSQSLSQTFSVLAFGLMPLAGAVAINFSAPLWSALVAIVFLKEKAGPVRWLVLLIGFTGVLIVTNPGADTLTLGAIFALLNAIMLGTVTVAVRGMASTESPQTLLIWQLSTVTFFHAFLLFFGVKWAPPADLALFALGGITNLIGQYFWTKALVLAPATAVSPFFYFMLVWVMVIGFLVWGDVPTTALLTGSAIVIASGLFLLWHEARRRRAKAA